MTMIDSHPADYRELFDEAEHLLHDWAADVRREEHRTPTRRELDGEAARIAHNLVVAINVWPIWGIIRSDQTLFEALMNLAPADGDGIPSIVDAAARKVIAEALVADLADVAYDIVVAHTASEEL